MHSDFTNWEPVEYFNKHPARFAQECNGREKHTPQSDTLIRYTDMSLNKDRLVSCLGGFWDDGVDHVRDVANNLEKSWHKKRKHARRQAKRLSR